MIKFNNVDIPSFVKVLDIKRDILPGQELNTLTIPARHGSYFYNRRHASRLIEVEIAVQATSLSDMRVKVRQLAEFLNANEPKPLVFTDEPDKEYYAIIDGQTALEETVYTGFATLAFLCPDPHAYATTETSTALSNGAGNVVNDGGVDAYPTIIATFTQPSTYFSIATSDKEKFIMLGEPKEVTKTAVPKKTPILHDTCSTVTGWAKPATVEGGVVGGNIISDGSKFYATDYGSGTGWHKATLKKSLSEPLQDFDCEVLVDMEAYGDLSNGNIGGVDVYLLDVNGTVVCKMTIGDWWADTRKTNGYIKIGDGAGAKTLLNATGDGATSNNWNYFDGMLRVRREGQYWGAYITKIDQSNGKHFRSVSKTFWDTKNQFQAPIAQIQVALSKYGTYATPQQSIKDIKINKINTPTDTQVPEIFQTGDVVEIDTSKAVVYKNGKPFMEALDPTSAFFVLKKGTNAIGYDPLVANVTVKHKKRWL